MKSHSQRALFAALGTTPTALSDFTCFGVRVTGTGIQNDPRAGCSPTENVGILGGLVPSTGGTVELSVPVGPARQIDIFGIQSAEGCNAMDVILARPLNTRFNQFGDFYLVGSATADIFDDTSVTMSVSFSGSTNKVLSGCPGWSSSNVPIAAVGGPAPLAGAVTKMSESGGIHTRLIIGSPMVLPPGGRATGGTGSSQITLVSGAAQE